MPVILETVSCNLQNHFNCENDNEGLICLLQGQCEFVRFLMVIDAEEKGVDHDCQHNNVLEGLRLYYFEALKSETIDWLHWNDLWVGMYQKSLNFDPFLLLFCEIMCTLSFLDFFVKLVDNDRNEQVHDKECGEENIDNENHSPLNFMSFYHY